MTRQDIPDCQTTTTKCVEGEHPARIVNSLIADDMIMPTTQTPSLIRSSCAPLLLSAFALSLLTACPTSGGTEPDESDQGKAADMRSTEDMAPDTLDMKQLADLDAGETQPSTQDMPLDATMSCVDTPLFMDGDGDGQGGGASTSSECLAPGEQPSDVTLVRDGGDCDDQDPLQYTGASGICGDRVDDDCDDEDEKCPESQPASTLLPSWDCTDSAPPANVYAWARFEQGNSHINPGCFVFFAAQKDLFYVQRVGLDDTDTCQRGQGCICQFDGGNGYDQRLYAFTRDADAQPCADIELGDGDNTVSNSCRKYLYHMYNDSRGYSFAATGEAAIKERLEAFESVEIACVKDVTFSGFPFQQLLSASVTFNEDFVMPE